MSEYDDLLDFEDEGATVTGERPTASGPTAESAPAASEQIGRDRASNLTKSGEPTSTPDDGALRPPHIIKTVEDVSPELERVTRRQTDLDWLLRRAGKKK